MDIVLAKEIIACLPERRTLFHYYRDRYAVYLLQRTVSAGSSLAKLHQGPYSRLLSKPLFKLVLAASGNGQLAAGQLEQFWPPDTQAYVLTLGIWGENERDWRWRQCSREGGNLVLQLNFCRQHDAVFRQLDRDGAQPFSCWQHPICRKGRNTMAWSRMDNRDAAQRILDRGEGGGGATLWDSQMELTALVEYYASAIRQHQAIWDEAMLHASLWFLLEEIGVETIYYHSFATSMVLKGIEDAPPRSLYTKLPKKFCFEQTEEVPAMIREDKRARRRLRKIRHPEFFRMNA